MDESTEKTPAGLTALRRRLEDVPHKKLLCAVLVLVMTGLQWLQLDLSCGTPLVTILTRRWVYAFVNLCLPFLVDLLFLLLTRRWRWAYILGSVLFGVWAVANHYTFLFSGDVLTLSSLRSIGTAANVLGGYHLAVDKVVVFILAAVAGNIALSVVLGWLTKPLSWRGLCAFLGGTVLLGGACFGALALLQRIDPIQDFSMRADVLDYGYPVHLVRHTYRMLNQDAPPAGYSDEAIDALAADVGPGARTVQSGTMPDIIFILNESFYNLDHYTDIDADVPYLECLNGLENAIRGYAVVPSVGGGTNQSEYELLTSNSMYLLACQAPFNTVDLSQANSVVSYLKSLGYKSPWAVHAFTAQDYNRPISYPALGFENIRFDDSLTRTSYGERYMLDETNYRDLFTLYLTAGEAPRLMYLLTFQNHGGYDQNDSELDTVHTGKDFGNLTDDVNEYLTSIQMSDIAIGRLTAYFNSVDRPVIICMVGDHAPSFINQLPARDSMTEEEAEVAARSVPFFIWANDAFGPIGARDAGAVSMPDLAPMVLDIAGLPLSAYYRTILDLSERIPVRLSTGLYRTAEGEYGYYSQQDSRFPLLSPYYFMEYNNLRRPDERRQVLFDPS